MSYCPFWPVHSPVLSFIKAYCFTFLFNVVQYKKTQGELMERFMSRFEVALLDYRSSPLIEVQFY